jgi:hypothetical protein
MFEPEEQPTSTDGPGQEEGSVLQRFLSQLGMPAGSGPNDLNSLGLQTADPQSRGLLDGPRLPRYYGAPPDHLPPSDLMPYSKVTPGDATDRVKFMLQRASAPAQPSESPVNNPYSHNSSSGIGSLLSRSSFARPEASDNSYRPDVSAYLAPALNRLFRGNRPGAPTLPNPLGGPPMPASLPGNGTSTSAPKAVTVRPDVAKESRSSEGTQILSGASDQGDHYSVQSDPVASLPPDVSTNLQGVKAANTARSAATQAGAQSSRKAANTAKPAGQTSQPATVWMMDSDHNLVEVPIKQYQSRLNDRYQLAIPLYFKNGAGLYVTQGELQQFMSKNYETERDFFQPGMRAVIQDANGKVIREVIVPSGNAGAEAQKLGAKLLPMTQDELKAFAQAKDVRARYNMANQEKGSAAARETAQRSGGLTRVDPSSPWKPDEYDKDRLMVPGAVDPRQQQDNVKTYLPHVIDGLKWRFGENSWQQYLPYALATINAETSTFEPVTQGNSKSKSKSLGRGFIQLSQDEYKTINDKLNQDAKNPADKVDLVNHPEQANDPKIAGRILAQFLSDRLNGYKGKDKKDKQADRNGLSDLLEKGKSSKPEQALTLYTTWLQSPTLANLKNLRNNVWVQARAVVNGHHEHGLPNGLERFLPALVFAERHKEIVEAAQDPNKPMTLQGAADMWVTGMSQYGGKNYAETLRKRLGFAKGANLSNIKVSDLPQPMLQEMLKAEREYALGVENALTRAQR